MQFEAGRVRRFQDGKIFLDPGKGDGIPLALGNKKGEFFARQAMAYPIKRQKQDDRTTSGWGGRSKYFQKSEKKPCQTANSSLIPTANLAKPWRNK